MTRPPTLAPSPPRRVLVSFETTERGRAALAEAAELARTADAQLTVLVALPPRERVDRGCGHCRFAASLWNHELDEVAQESVAEARAMLSGLSGVDYQVTYGSAVKTITEAAELAGADVIVLGEKPPGRWRRRVSPGLAERLRTAGGWHVVVAGR